MRDLAGKCAVITGGAEGIGLGMATAFAEAGMRLALLDIDGAALEKARAKLAPHGVQVDLFTIDVAERAAMADTAAAVKAACGAVHILCNNAGVGGAGGPLHALPDSEWDWVIGVNLQGVINSLQSFLPLLLDHDQGSHVVNTASMSGLLAAPNLGIGAYTTSKFAVVGLSEALEHDLASTGVGVSVLCPGFVRTRILEGGRNRPARHGGAFAPPPGNPMAALIAEGLDPLHIGRRVRHAVLNDEFYILTHPEWRRYVIDRHDRVMRAFDAAEEIAREA